MKPCSTPASLTEPQDEFKSDLEDKQAEGSQYAPGYFDPPNSLALDFKNGSLASIAKSTY
jgi:hypothetical protein